MMAMTKNELEKIQMRCDAYINNRSSPAIFATSCCGDVPALLDDLKAVTEERDHLKSLSDAQERAMFSARDLPAKNIYLGCNFCMFGESGTTPIDDCQKCKGFTIDERGGWVFDAERFRNYEK